VLLVFERLKLEILSRVYPELRSEARKPGSLHFARESGVVEISRSEDEAVGVRVIEDSGR